MSFVSFCGSDPIKWMLRFALPICFLRREILRKPKCITSRPSAWTRVWRPFITIWVILTSSTGQVSQAIVQFSEALRLNLGDKDAEENLRLAKVTDAQLFPQPRK
jgi:hypothetical protein